LKVSIGKADHENTVISVLTVSLDAPDTLLLNNIRIAEVPFHLAVKQIDQAQHRLSLGGEDQIQAVKLLEDGSILALIKRTKQAMLVNIPSAFVADWTRSGVPAVAHDEDVFILHKFGQDDGFVPARMIISDKKPRKYVIVSDVGNRAWKIFSLGHGATAAKVEMPEDEDGYALGEDVDIVEDSMLVD